jgi:PKD repeat protein/Cu/Zn superoxide dismutase
MKKIISIMTCLVLLAGVVQAQVKINNYEYWFDNDFGGKTLTNITTPEVSFNLLTELTLPALSNGLHTFHVRFQSTDGKWSSVLSQFFQKLPNGTLSTNKISAYESWVDNGYANKVNVGITPETSFNLIDSIPMASLNNGLHTFHIRFMDERGQWSSVLSQFFQKLPSTSVASNTNMNGYEYWVDNNYGAKTLVSITAVNTLQLIDSLPMASLNNGLHTFHIRFRDERGQWSSVLSQFFQKLPSTTTGTNSQMTAYEYWLDNNYGEKVEQTITPTQQFQLIDSLPFASASNGLHTFHIRFMDEKGQWSTVLSQFFQKLPSSGTGGNNQLTAYEYWLDNSYSTKVTTSIAAASTYQLLDSIPFASAVNGLHTFHIRFQDQKGQWSTVLSQYFQKLPSISSNIPNLVTAYQYWVDTTASTRTLVNLPDPANPYNLLTDIDLSWVPKGNHDFQIQFKDTLGMWSCVLTDTFYKFPTPRALFVADNYALCDSGTVSFTNQSFDADTLRWDFGDGTISNLTDPTHFYANPGTYQVKLVAYDTTQSVRDSVTLSVNVVQTPIFTLQDSISVCAGTQVVLDAGNVAEKYLWSTGDTTHSITVPSTGDYWVRATNQNLCSHSDTITVNINPLPIVTVSGLDTLYCNTAGPISLTGNPTGGIFSGAGMTGVNFNPSTVSVGHHSIAYTYTNGLGCTDSAIVVTNVIVCDNIREFASIGAFNVYPNPFNFAFNIGFSIKKDSQVKIKLMDITNRELEAILDERKSEGEYNLYYDGSHLANGIYYLYIIIDNEYAIKRIVRVN